MGMITRNAVDTRDALHHEHDDAERQDADEHARTDTEPRRTSQTRPA